MARWEGNTRGRLERAALTLFRDQGYDRTTVAQIARHAGLTERSFYRWFTDKREVLFAGDELQECLLAAIDDVPSSAGALATLLAAFAAAPQVIRPRPFLVERSAVIADNPPLQERELIKMATLTATLAAALVHRGVDEYTAGLAGAVGVAVLRSAIERWVADEYADFAELLATSAADLLAVAADIPTADIPTADLARAEIPAPTVGREPGDDL